MIFFTHSQRNHILKNCVMYIWCRFWERTLYWCMCICAHAGYPLDKIICSDLSSWFSKWFYLVFNNTQYIPCILHLCWNVCVPLPLLLSKASLSYFFTYLPLAPALHIQFLSSLFLCECLCVCACIWGGEYVFREGCACGGQGTTSVSFFMCGPPWFFFSWDRICH